MNQKAIIKNPYFSKSATQHPKNDDLTFHTSQTAKLNTNVIAAAFPQHIKSKENYNCMINTIGFKFSTSSGYGIFIAKKINESTAWKPLNSINFEKLSKIKCLNGDLTEKLIKINPDFHAFMNLSFNNTGPTMYPEQLKKALWSFLFDENVYTKDIHKMTKEMLIVFKHLRTIK